MVSIKTLPSFGDVAIGPYNAGHVFAIVYAGSTNSDDFLKMFLHNYHSADSMPIAL